LEGTFQMCIILTAKMTHHPLIDIVEAPVIEQAGAVSYRVLFDDQCEIGAGERAC
jgi:hypothetical protein